MIKDSEKITYKVSRLDCIDSFDSFIRYHHKTPPITSIYFYCDSHFLAKHFWDSFAAWIEIWQDDETNASNTTRA